MTACKHGEQDLIDDLVLAVDCLSNLPDHLLENGLCRLCRNEGSGITGCTSHGQFPFMNDSFYSITQSEINCKGLFLYFLNHYLQHNEKGCPTPSPLPSGEGALCGGCAPCTPLRGASPHTPLLGLRHKKPASMGCGAKSFTLRQAWVLQAFRDSPSGQHLRRFWQLQ